jgi:hypothetical protein
MRLIKNLFHERSQAPGVAERYFITYCLGCCLGLAGIWFLQAPPGFPMGGPSDFTSFYTAAHIIRAGEGANLYDLETQTRFQNAWLRPHGWVFKDGLMVYIYPPFFALPFLPLTFLPLGWAFHIWNVVSAFLLLVAIRTLIGRGGASRFGHPALILLIVVSFFPVFEVFNKGQSTFLLLYLLAMFYRQFRHGRDLPAGIALGLGLIKPQLTLLFLLWGITRKSWRMIAAFFATALALAAASLAIVGPGGIRQYLLLSRTAMSWDGPYSFLPALMPNLRGTLFRINRLLGWLGLDTLCGRDIFVLSLIATGAGVLILLYCLGGREWNEISFDLNFALVMLAALIVTPYIYNHDLALTLMIGFIAFGIFQARGEPDRGKRFVAAGHISLLIAMSFLSKTLSAQTVLLILCGAFLLIYNIKRKSVTKFPDQPA